jgi:predicted amidohydrolase YtcJ
MSIDRLIRAGAIHAMDGAVHRAMAIGGGTIVAVSEQPDGLDDLIDSTTAVTDCADLTILPAFADAHEHLMEAARNTSLVPVDRVGSIAEFCAAVERAARTARPGDWVLTSMAWHESNLAENRMPTARELDAVSAGHPVIARRGGHLAVANTAALARAGIAMETPDPSGGAIGRDAGGSLTGILEGAAVYQVLAFAPPPPRSALVEGVRQASGRYAAFGVATIREAMITKEELEIYQSAADTGALQVRVRPLIRVPNDIGAQAAIAMVESLGVHSGFGDDRLRVWGLKMVIDGGVEGCALDQPYASNSTSTGHVNWDLDVMAEVCTTAVRGGWRIGTHAVGDRGVRLLLDVYERVITAVPDLPRGTLVIEHGLLADPEQQARAARLGVGVTVQHALLWNMGSQMLRAWGAHRTARANPVDEWLAAGAEVAVGTDIVRPVNPLLSVWGLVTRGTRSAGVQGPEHAIDRRTAVELYTAGSARLDREADRRGTIAPGKLADIVAYPADPLTVDVDALPELTPTFTVIGGEPVYDPGGRLG